MLAAHIDFETASAADLRKTGVHRMCEHPSTFPWCMSWRLGEGGPVQRWRPGYPDPVALLAHVASGGRVMAHNAIFERTTWNWILRRRFVPHWPALRIEQQDCTMARCAVLAIPMSLDIASKALGARAKKDMEGNALMQKMMRPRKINEDGTYVWWDDPALIERLMVYCDQDVVTESEIDSLAPPLTPAEREAWMLDQRINDRGVMLDVPTIQHAIHVREIAKQRLDDAMREVTGGLVAKCTQTKALVTWINSLGITCVSIAKSEQAAVLADADEELGEDLQFTRGESDLPNVVRRAVALRADRNKTSTAKLTAMLNCVCSDGRARGQLSYHGTNTGRWAGRLIQMQNLYRVDPDKDGNDIDMTVHVLTTCAADDAHDMLFVLFGSPMTMLAKSLRNMIIAAPGNSLKGADLANIEGRIAAWLAGEEWKLDAFRLYDAGRGPDLYIVAYARSFGIELGAVTKAQRQIGKVEELALGYQGGAGSFVSMGKVYGLKPAALVPAVQAAAPDEWAFYMDRYAGARDKRGLPQDQWAAIKTIVQGWRTAHPKITQGWWDLQDAAIEAVANPGQVVFVFQGRVAYMTARGFLWCRLPSGRVLAYASPRLRWSEDEWVTMPDGKRHDADEYFPHEWAELLPQLLAAGGVHKQAKRRQVDYDGYDGEHKKWGTFSLYGGKQFNHIVQGTARDVMLGGMLRMEAAGYNVVLTVHDEVLDESPEWFGSYEEVEQLMTAGEPWLEGCPLAAKGWEGPRYAK